MFITALWGCSETSISPKVVVSRSGDTVIIKNNIISITYDLSRGMWSAYRRGGEVVIKDALSGSDPQVSAAPSDTLQPWSYSVSDSIDNLGEGKIVVFLSPPAISIPLISQSISAYDGQGFFTVSETAVNPSGAPITEMTMVPIVTAPTGGVFLGRKPSTHRFLDNSSLFVPEIYINIIPGNKGSTALWNQAIYDLDSGKSLVTGFLSFEHGMPVISAVPTSVTSSGGREGWSFSATVNLAPGKTIPPGSSFTSETFYMDFSSGSPQDGLEIYARNAASFLGKSPWKGRVPSGWNSWGGGGSNGGYGQNISEGLILTNLDFMAVNFKPFGQEYFQVDDGWETADGDWDTNMSRFPHGLAWLADQISSRGFLPGLWMAPFDVETNITAPTTIYQVNDAWTIDTASAFGVPCPKALDLSNPGAVQWAGQFFSIVSHEWGYRWIKNDFGYCALSFQYLNPSQAVQSDMTLTFAEAYRRGMKAARMAMGDKTFFLGVGGLGLDYGIVDGNRISLDNMPWWESKDPSGAWASGAKNIICYPAGPACFSQGIKPTVRTVARKYYLHGSVWINHPDMIYVRPPVTENEAVSFASLVAMSGGVAKLGERVSETTRFGVDVYRRLLPVYGKMGRPMDLFERELPEVWDLKVDRPFEAWDIVGLFNWGTNMDLTVNPYGMIPEGVRTISVDLASMGLDTGTDYLAYEFWGEEFIGSVRGRLALSLDPRTVKLVALRKKLDHPQLLGTNRHFTMGGEDIGDVAWDQGSSTLTVSLTANTGTSWNGKDFPFEHHLAFYVPDPYALTGIDSEPKGAAEIMGRTRNLLRLSLHAPQSRSIILTLKFIR